MLIFFRKLFIFLRRDFLITVSYKVNLIIGLFGMFIGVLKFGFMAKFLSLGNTFPLINKSGGDLISYLITGGIFMSYVSVSVNSFKSTIRSEQSMGTLEYLLISNTPLYQILLFNAISNFLWTTIDSVSIFVVVLAIFNFKTNINLWLTVFILLLSIVCISGIGLASAGIIMVTKKGDPIGWLFTTITGLVSGIFYPISVLPKALRLFSYVFPTTYAMEALRRALISGATFKSVETQIIVLICMALLTVPLGILVFTWGFNRARIDGSLSQY